MLLWNQRFLRRHRPVSSCPPKLNVSPSRTHIRMLFHFFTYSHRSTAQISKVGDGGRRLISKRVHSSPFRNVTLTASTVSKFAFGSLSNGCRIHPRYTRLRLVRVLNFKNNKIIWRWRESNPRPKRHSGNIYMLRLLFFRLNQGKNQNLTI